MIARSKYTRLMAWLAALVLFVPLSLRGQEVPGHAPSVAPGQIEIKSQAPVSEEILHVRLPRAIEAKLSNGLTVLILEDHRLPSVFSQLHIRGAGALFEPENLPGLASATAQMLREGTQNRTGRRIAEELDRLGASVGASSNFGSTDTVFTASGLSDNFDEWFPVAVDILLNPSFPGSELNRFKQRAAVQLRQQRASPRFLAAERFNHAVFDTHPAAVVTATPDSIAALTPDLLRDWHRRRYSPQNSVLAFAGNVYPSQLLPKLEKWLGGWQTAPPKWPLPANPVPADSRKVYLVDRPNSVQTTLVVGNIAIDRRSEDFVPMVVMNHLLGGGPASRLFLNLREAKGYTYGAYSSFTALEYPGPWNTGTDVRTEVTDGALTEIFNEVRRVRESPVEARELTSTKRAVVAAFALALEQPTRLLNLALIRKLYNLPEDYWDRYPEKVNAVTAEDLQRVARAYLDPDRLQVVAVGDGRKIKPVLEKYGTLRLYDSSGNPVPSGTDTPNRSP